MTVLSNTEYARCREKIVEGLEQIGFVDDLKGKKVLLKPNLLSPRTADSSVTTNPEFLGAVASVFLQRGATVSVGDSPARASAASVARVSGIEKVCNELSIPLVEFDEPVQVLLEKGVYRRFEIARPVLEADIVVNLPKLKTHSLTLVTFGVKNLFGCVPGSKKQGWHFRARNMSDFSRMLVELASYINPSLTIMDGVEGMDGNGPANGRKIYPGVIAISRDVFALDDAVASICGIKHSRVPILRIARELGFVSSYETVGDKIERIDLVLPETNYIAVYGARLLRRFVTKFPAIDHKRCIKCGNCESACPAGAITLESMKIDYSKCITCYVCHELCPENAILFRRRLL